MESGVGRPVLQQGKVAEEDENLGVVRCLYNGPLQGGAYQCRLIGQEA